MRGWLMVLATLTASITYSAALNPPSGVWQDDNPANGQFAGDPVLRHIRPSRYTAFYYCNVTSFASSVCIIAQLSVPKLFDRISILICNILVAIDIFGLMGAFAAASSGSVRDSIYVFTSLAVVVVSVNVLVAKFVLHYRVRM